MADLRDVVILTYTPVRSDAGLHGSVIGAIYGNYAPYQCTIDYALLHDGWVPMVIPPTWKQTGKQGWVEWSHCVEQGSEPGEEVKLLVTYYSDGRAPTVQRVG